LRRKIESAKRHKPGTIVASRLSASLISANAPLQFRLQLFALGFVLLDQDRDL
jgi:hypothetical protein